MRGRSWARNSSAIVPFARRSTDDVPQLVELEEVDSLAAQQVGDHWGLRTDRRDDGHTHDLGLKAFHKWSKIAVVANEHDVVEMRREFSGNEHSLDVHIEPHPVGPRRREL